MRLAPLSPRPLLLLALANCLPLLFRAWRIDGSWEQIHSPPCARGCAALGGREPTPSAAIIDSQRAKTTE
jgi:hypothetical protein